MKILIACEFSGIVRDAFINLGFDATSCDLEPSESDGPHYVGNVLDIIDNGWDCMIAFPPCTYLCSSGARWWANRKSEQRDALEFVMLLMLAKIPRITIENPVGIISSAIRKPDQYIQPWQFGEAETKKTGLWLKGLPKLHPTNIVSNPKHTIHRMPPSKDRGKIRSRTFKGIADAMATQWGNYLGEVSCE